MPTYIHCLYAKMQEISLFNYTPGIYADGYIVFAFPFACSFVRSFVEFMIEFLLVG